MEERVEVVLRVAVSGLLQEGKRVETRWRWREELVAELLAATNNYDSAIGEELVGGVPSAGGQRLGLFEPVGVWFEGVEGADGAVTVVEAAGLEEGGVREEGGGGAERVGEEAGEGADGGGREVEEEGVGGA